MKVSQGHQEHDNDDDEKNDYDDDVNWPIY